MRLDAQTSPLFMDDICQECKFITFFYTMILPPLILNFIFIFLVNPVRCVQAY